MSLHTLRGMNDLFPEEAALWTEVEQKAREFFSYYGYEEIRTPLLEELALFTRTLGGTTNIVEKEMYSFQDHGEKWVALRPEGTASVVRAYIESGRAAQDPIGRFFYMGPMFRHERPQKGRFRQFHQIGVEVFGIQSPLLDAEMIHMLDLYFKSLGLTHFEIELNSLGCPICRPPYHKAFYTFLSNNQSLLCEDCRRRMEKNPLRVLDCKEEGCQKLTEEAPSIQDHLCNECEKDFDTVLQSLGRLNSSYKINPRIVRGLDYYTKTTFEFTASELGAQNAVAGGGRYDGLVRLMGGPPLPGVGFAIGEERLIESLKLKRGVGLPVGKKAVFIAPIGEKAEQEAFQLAHRLRQERISAELDYNQSSLKSQMRRADKMRFQYVLILGDDELKKKVVILRNMTTQEQSEVPLAQIIQRLREIRP
ncbi:MAG: histidine--tRNA ligase [Deltaproteobacteria bacterium]|nr:histidine--tRNA ligase [Deltaproteobacteria bacterium]